MKPRVWTSAWLAVFILSGCALYTLVEPTRRPVGDAFSVDPQIAWSAREYGKNMEVWTVDGSPLEALFFIKGLSDGETLLYQREGVVTKEPPRYKTYMNANEVMEFIVDSMTYAGRGQVEATNLRPTSFGEARGYRFEYSYLTGDGLEMEGFAVGAVLNKRLYLIFYEGARQYYFGKYRADVDKLIESISLLQRTG